MEKQARGGEVTCPRSRCWFSGPRGAELLGEPLPHTVSEGTGLGLWARDWDQRCHPSCLCHVKQQRDVALFPGPREGRGHGAWSSSSGRPTVCWARLQRRGEAGVGLDNPSPCRVRLSALQPAPAAASPVAPSPRLPDGWDSASIPWPLRVQCVTPSHSFSQPAIASISVPCVSLIIALHNC